MSNPRATPAYLVEHKKDTATTVANIELEDAVAALPMRESTRQLVLDVAHHVLRTWTQPPKEEQAPTSDTPNDRLRRGAIACRSVLVLLKEFANARDADATEDDTRALIDRLAALAAPTYAKRQQTKRDSERSLRVSLEIFRPSLLTLLLGLLGLLSIQHFLPVIVPWLCNCCALSR
jgi:hypothetical protein